MNEQMQINVVKDFYPRPKWRYRDEGEGSGEAFRDDRLVQALRTNSVVIVNLTGYNRYGPSFISEAFGGLIRTSGFKIEELKTKLVIKHDDLPSIVQVCWKEIEKASKEVEK